MEITVSGMAMRFAAKRGAQIFVWAEPSGLAHVTTSPPPTGGIVQWETTQIDDLSLFVDDSLQVAWLRIVFRPLPFPHLWANWPGKWADGGGGGG